MNKQNLKMIPCPKCSEPFPELRKINYGYNHCVNCSTVERKVAITTVEGTGDHTYNDLIINPITISLITFSIIIQNKLC